MRLAIALIGLLLCQPLLASRASAAAAPPVAHNAPGPTYYDISSPRSGKTYRLFISVPRGAAPRGGFPVVYVLDGNWHFNTAADAGAIQSAVGEISPAVIVGIGYPTNDQSEILRRRWEDLALAGDADALPPRIRALEPSLGGSEAFLALLNDKVKPLIESLTSVNRNCQTLYGHSLGGLFVLHTLFTSTPSFQSYVAASPAIWWSDNALLAEASAFIQRITRASPKPRLLLTVGELEQHREIVDPAVAERVARARMVDNVTDLGATLSSARINVKTIVYPDETHNSVVPGTISRALRFGLKCQGENAIQKKSGEGESD